MSNDIHFVFNLVKTHNFGQERRRGGWIYCAERVGDDFRGTPIVEDRLIAGAPAQLARKVVGRVLKIVGDIDYSWSFNWHSVEEEVGRRGVIIPLKEDFSHDEYVKFMCALLNK